MKLLITLFLTFAIDIFGESDNNELIIDVEKSLMAVCCYSGTVYDHGNKEMEEQIVRFVNQGKSKEEILNFYTDRYGEKVLALPKTEGFNLFAWIAPMMIAVLGFTIITVYINSKNDVEENLEFSKDNSIDYSDQIESDLKDLD